MAVHEYQGQQYRQYNSYHSNPMHDRPSTEIQETCPKDAQTKQAQKLQHGSHFSSRLKNGCQHMHEMWRHPPQARI